MPFPGSAGESCKPAVELLGDSVLPRHWPGPLANFEVMLQNQNAVLEEVAAENLPLFPTVLPLSIVSVKCCSSAVVQPTFVCLEISVLGLDRHSVLFRKANLFKKNQCSLVGRILAVGLGSTGVSPGRVVSGKELLCLLNSNDMKRNEGKIVVLTCDLLVLFTGG